MPRVVHRVNHSTLMLPTASSFPHSGSEHLHCFKFHFNDHPFTAYYNNPAHRLVRKQNYSTLGCVKLSRLRRVIGCTSLIALSFVTGHSAAHSLFVVQSVSFLFSHWPLLLCLGLWNVYIQHRRCFCTLPFPSVICLFLFTSKTITVDS